MNWHVIRAVSAKPQGYVWEVREEPPAGGAGASPRGALRHGFFKFTTPKNHYWGGPAAANELIAAGLARLVGLDAADVVPARIEGHLGAVSLVRPAAHLVGWRELSKTVQGNVRRHIANAHQFRLMLAFDVWVLNIDRATGKNIIAYKETVGSPWRVYFIDHGHTLHGNYDRWRWGGPPHARFWNDLWRYYGVPSGVGRYLTAYRQVEPYVRRIAAITREQIRREVRAVPSGLLTRDQADLIEDLLLWRQRRVAFILRRWFGWQARQRRQRPRRR
ncbi:MAG: hypothetical protein M1602_03225 [Firmicutes bacterium]|nr:hypothetical protein [Bacillota bacterium]